MQINTVADGVRLLWQTQEKKAKILTRTELAPTDDAVESLSSPLWREIIPTRERHHRQIGQWNRQKLPMVRAWQHVWRDFLENPESYYNGEKALASEDAIRPTLNAMIYDNSLTTWQSSWKTQRTVLAILIDGERKSRTLEDPTAQEYHTAEFLAARLADREIPIGLVARSCGRNYEVVAKFSGNGAFVTAFRIHEEPTHLYLAMRGTANGMCSTGAMKSMINDVQHSAGTWGVRAVFPQIYRYMHDFGYREATIVGKSLGGAMAQQLAVLLDLSAGEQRVRKLITIASIGSGNTEPLFVRCLNQRQKRDEPAFEVSVYRAAGDFTPTTGGEHLGFSQIMHPSLNMRIFYLAARTGAFALAEGSNLVPALTDVPEMTPTQTMRWLIHSLPREHTHQFTLERDGYHCREVLRDDNHDLFREELALGRRTEGIRRRVATTVSILSFGSLYAGPLSQRDLVTPTAQEARTPAVIVPIEEKAAPVDEPLKELYELVSPVEES